jgi:Mycothiol maleylpyruvate isomerase N-terminal domain
VNAPVFPQRTVFFDATFSVADLIAAPVVGCHWGERSCLEGFTVGGLAGHIVRSVQALLDLLERPLPEGARVVSPAEFFGVNKPRGPVLDDPIAKFIVDDGEQRAELGQESVVGTFRELVVQVEGVLGDLTAPTVIPTIRIPDGITCLGIYLTTRVVELVIHGDDLASSVGIDWQPPFAAGALAIGMLVQMANEQHGAVEVLRVLARSERANSDVFPVL